jgi:polysaccharide deacetylase 2 family uncharacterized protein YibQ
MDDLGRDLAPLERLLRLDLPLTIAVLPHQPFSRASAALAQQQGHEVLLHLPMAANGARGPAPAEAIELRPGMSPEEVRALVAAMLATVPGAQGVNNHQGSRASQDTALMGTLMAVLGGRGLYFLDSRTSGASVAYAAAQRAGLRAAYRTVFLDDTPTREETARQLRAAMRQAREHGWAIAIGHPHTSTLETLEEMLPRMRADGIQLVVLSQLVQ